MMTTNSFFSFFFFFFSAKRIMDNTVYIHVTCMINKIYMKGIVQRVSLGDLPPAEGQLGTRWLGGVGMISLP